MPHKNNLAEIERISGEFVCYTENKPGAAHNVCAVFMLDECIEGCIIRAYLMNIYSDARKPANRPAALSVERGI